MLSAKKKTKRKKKKKWSDERTLARSLGRHRYGVWDGMDPPEGSLLVAFALKWIYI